MLYLDIFKGDYVSRTPRTGSFKPRDLEYLKRLYIFNKEAIQSYYLDRNFFVKNTNIISRLLGHIPLYLDYSVYRYVELMRNRLTYLAKHFKFTSEIELGVLHPPYFFGNEGEEIVFAGYDNFDAIKYSANWSKESCIQTLLHPRNDTKLLLPLGNDNGSKGGLGSVYIDIIKLAIKYREFMRRQAALGDEGHQSKNVFVIKYVLAPMMDDVIDHVFMNMVMDKFYGREQQVPDKIYPFKIFEPTTQVNRYVDDTLEVITGKSMDFITLLRQIKLIYHEDASTLLALPDLYGTRQSLPALIGTRIDHLLFMHDVCKDKKMNKHYINDWKRLATRLLGDSKIDAFYSYETAKDIKEKLTVMKSW